MNVWGCKQLSWRIRLLIVFTGVPGFSCQCGQLFKGKVADAGLKKKKKKLSGDVVINLFSYSLTDQGYLHIETLHKNKEFLKSFWIVYK